MARNRVADSFRTLVSKLYLPKQLDAERVSASEAEVEAYVVLPGAGFLDAWELVLIGF